MQILVALALAVIASANSSPLDARVAVDSSGDTHERRLPVAGAVLTFAIPLAGSLGPISGRVTGLANPQNYMFCVYLSSYASGVELVNGPKPLWVARDNSVLHLNPRP